MATPTLNDRFTVKEVKTFQITLPGLALIVLLSLTAGSLLTKDQDLPAGASEAPSAKVAKTKPGK